MVASQRVSLIAALALSLGLGATAAAQKGAGAPKDKPPAAAKAPKAPKAPKGGKGAPAKKVDVEAQRAALEGSDEAAATAAAKALGESDAAAAHDALLDALSVGLAPGVAAAALTSLAAHPAKGDLAVLGFYARYRDSDVRAAAAAGLGLQDGGAATKALIRALGDEDAKVRAAAARSAAAGKVKAASEALLALLAKGDEPAAAALAAIADPDLALVIGEQLGNVPDSLLATTLGLILLRKDFGPDTARVEVVRALGKVQSAEATSMLTEYVSSTPEKPPRQSRREAEAMVEARIGGDN
jgi:HEAT repeat protein